MHEEGALATDDGLTAARSRYVRGEEGFKPIYVVAVLTGVVHVYAALSVVETTCVILACSSSASLSSSWR
ncbi:MAG: hypothetical protein V9G15_12940 [Dermatophilaceae bacterium]